MNNQQLTCADKNHHYEEEHLLFHLPQPLRNKWEMEAKEINRGGCLWGQKAEVCIFYLDGWTEKEQVLLCMYDCKNEW